MKEIILLHILTKMLKWKKWKKKQFSVGFGATTKSSEKGMHDDNKAFWKQLEIS